MSSTREVCTSPLLLSKHRHYVHSRTYSTYTRCFCHTVCNVYLYGSRVWLISVTHAAVMRQLALDNVLLADSMIRLNVDCAANSR